MIIVWTRREQLKAWLLLFMLGFPLLRPLGRIILNFHSSVKYHLWEMEIKSRKGRTQGFPRGLIAPV